MTIEDRGRIAGQRTVATFEVSTKIAQDYDKLIRRRRSQRRNRGMAFVVALVVAVFAVFLAQSNLSPDSTPQPIGPVPGIGIGNVPVWYDDAGLHRGDFVERTPVELRQLHQGEFIEKGALALVRTGALYLNPATGDVWFHPWGGDPRIVGHHSTTGPSANPSGDIAAWFDGYDLVVYDAAADREIARKSGNYVRELPFGSSTCHTGCYEHDQPGNGFLQVSAERVVWTAYRGEGPSYVYDVSTGKVSSLPNTTIGGVQGAVVDVHDDAAVYALDDEKNPWGWHLAVDMPDRAPQEYPEVSPDSRFSPSGNYILSVVAWVGDMGERDAAAIIDTRTGKFWPLPTRYSWIAWSYGDIALLQEGNELVACDPAGRTCDSLPAEGPILMPTS